MTAPLPTDEAGRLSSLREQMPIGEAAQASLNQIVTLATRACGVPIAFVTLVDSGKELVIAQAGADSGDIQRDVSFGTHAVAGTTIFEVANAAADPRFVGHPLVAGPPRIRFFAAIPLVCLEGHAIGTLSIADTSPGRLDPERLQALRNLADLTMRLLELRRIARSLRASEEQHRILFEQNPQPLWVYDQVTQRFLAVNDAAVQLYGYDREEFLSMTVDAILENTPDSRGQVRLPGEQRHAKKDGTLLAVEVIVHEIEFRGRSATLELITDVTEKKKLLEQLLRTQRVENLGLLAAGIAHDFNNILTPVLMASPLLRAVTPRESQHLLELLEQSAERGAALVRQILAFAHGPGGELHPVQLRPIAREMMSLVEETFPRSLKIETEIDRNLWMVRANPTQVHQVLLNLCVNARDAMPRGGQIRLRLANREFDAASAASVPGARPGRFVMLEVSDTGVGIPPDILARIWEPFFTTKPTGKGSGLGLSTIRGIVQTHRGFRSVTSHPGQGTTFRIFLPAEAELTADIAHKIPLKAPNGSGELVMLVDDEANVRRAAIAVLTSGGYRVVAAQDGAEAVSLLALHQSDLQLVITDRHMPRFGGDELVALLRRLHPHIGILLISGLSKDEDPGVNAPPATALADATLPKPFKPEALLQSVYDLLHRATV